MTTRRNILIVGATGQQGSATVDALLALPPTSPPIHILALTRNKESAKSKALVAAHPDTVTLIHGDTKDASAAFESKDLEGIKVDALFLFTLPMTPENVIGRAWIDAAVVEGVSQIVLSTVDRGGERSWINPTNVPHFSHKHENEVHLRNKAEEVAKKGGKLYWTILRPAAFLENFNPGFFVGLFIAMWAHTSPPTKALQFIGTRDLGFFAAKAFAAPAEWDQKAISLAGDEITLPQARETFKKVVGKEIPESWNLLARLMLWAITDVGRMFAWFSSDGYGANIAELKAMEPRLQNFEEWLKESKWVKEKKA
jgi:nucleoside-diphosphate-sugar epimerase